MDLATRNALGPDTASRMKIYNVSSDQLCLLVFIALKYHAGRKRCVLVSGNPVVLSASFTKILWVQ